VQEDAPWRLMLPVAGRPLPADATFAGTVSARHGDLLNRLLGDGLIPMGVALGSHAHAPHDLAFPSSRVWVGYGVHDLASAERSG
jgi:hypothetical protein